MRTKLNPNRTVSKTVAQLLLKIKAVTFHFKPPYTYTSGLKSPIYLDNRLVMSYPKIRRQIINYYVQAIKDQVGLKNIQWVSATATAAIPHGAFVAYQLQLPMIYVRPTSKSYGKGNQIEGYLKKGAQVVIIEDHISTAASIIGNTQAIRKAGGKVRYVIATTTYETKQSLTNLKQDKLQLINLTTGKIIVDTAFKQGLLSPAQKASVELWFHHPTTWFKRVGLE